MTIIFTNKSENWQFSLEVNNYQITGSVSKQDSKISNINGNVNVNSDSEDVIAPMGYVCSFNYNVSMDNKVNITYSELPENNYAELQIMLNDVIKELITKVNDNE